MIRMLGLILIAMAAGSAESVPTTQTWTGWFSDKQCAHVRADEAPRPNGTACVKKCLDQGTAPVFISEQAKAVYEVREYPSVKDDVGYYLQVTAQVDEQAKTIVVKSVKRLSEVTPMCLLPKKTATKE
jgi:hypothetical protein